MRKKILTIGITSYNRIGELERCLGSVGTRYPAAIEVLVSEDKSPQRHKIKEMVENFSKKAPYDVIFHSNDENLGYDRNLKNIIDMSHGEYVFLISDDDYIVQGAVDKILGILKRHQPGMLYGAYKLIDGSYGRMYIKSKKIKKSVKYASEHMLDSILFSGLVFKKDVVDGLNAEPFLNKNYFQIYLFLYTLSFFGGIYLNTPTVVCVGDGENAYGKSKSSIKNPLLADRKSVYSNLEFHKGLIYTVRKFDQDFNTNTFKKFEREYNLHSITGLSRAEEVGKDHLKRYWEKMNALDIEINYISRVYYFMLLTVGAKNAKKLLSIPKVILKKIRHER